MKLYKYVTEERIDILVNSQIRFSSPLSLNDPFELKPNIMEIASEEKLLQNFDSLFTKLVIEEYGNYATQIPLDKILDICQRLRPNLKRQFPTLVRGAIPEIKLAIHRALAKSIGILCLSESPINLLMWAHYANSHRGFVIEFESSSNFFNQTQNDSNNFQRLHKVKYVKTMPQVTLEKMDNFDPFTCKSIEWSYEQEWRMLLPLASANNKKDCDGPLAVHLFNLPSECITSILLGAMITQKTEKDIVALVDTNPKFSHVKLYKAFVDDQNYKMNIYPFTH